MPSGVEVFTAADEDQRALIKRMSIEVARHSAEWRLNPLDISTGARRWGASLVLMRRSIDSFWTDEEPMSGITAATSTPMNLKSLLVSAIEAHRGLALNPYLQLTLPAVELVESRVDSIPELGPYITRLKQIIKDDPDMAIHGRAVNEFMQTLGEANFIVTCAERGVALDRIPESKDCKTPDFALRSSVVPMHFEVKTLSVVSGDQGIHQMLEETLESAVEIDGQLRSKERIAIASSVIAPYGTKNTVGVLYKAARVILEKARGNMKQGQYLRPNTFLVLNMSLLNTLPGGRGNLTKMFDFHAPHDCRVSGALWNSMFGSPEDVFVDISDFEGDDRNTFPFEKRGLLVDEEFDALSGVLFLMHPFNEPAELWGLWRSASEAQWRGSGVDDLLRALVGDCWNDEIEQNSGALNRSVDDQYAA